MAAMGAEGENADILKYIAVSEKGIRLTARMDRFFDQGVAAIKELKASYDAALSEQQQVYEAEKEVLENQIVELQQ